MLPVDIVDPPLLLHTFPSSPEALQSLIIVLWVSFLPPFFQSSLLILSKIAFAPHRFVFNRLSGFSFRLRLPWASEPYLSLFMAPQPHSTEENEYFNCSALSLICDLQCLLSLGVAFAPACFFCFLTSSFQVFIFSLPLFFIFSAYFLIVDRFFSFLSLSFAPLSGLSVDCSLFFPLSSCVVVLRILSRLFAFCPWLFR